MQFLRPLDLAADAVAGSGVTVVIEPLNRTESDIANSVTRRRASRAP
ncbi:hypothetical protein GQA70_22795 (plasmid) [Ponticoccus alexandrii]|uniref:Uncharacterized protein n=1 Tax=Ponticoccus alexandrii TaxID=1943633 RepID=A0ABX7FGZ2_9RHOB|nr:hypothetical protein GQA70_22795 [Ponticoccus alexandrii]